MSYRGQRYPLVRHPNWGTILPTSFSLCGASVRPIGLPLRLLLRWPGIFDPCRERGVCCPQKYPTLPLAPGFTRELWAINRPQQYNPQLWLVFCRSKHTSNDYPSGITMFSPPFHLYFHIPPYRRQWKIWTDLLKGCSIPLSFYYSSRHHSFPPYSKTSFDKLSMRLVSRKCPNHLHPRTFYCRTEFIAWK